MTFDRAGFAKARASGSPYQAFRYPPRGNGQADAGGDAALLVIEGAVMYLGRHGILLGARHPHR